MDCAACRVLYRHSYNDGGLRLDVFVMISSQGRDEKELLQPTYTINQAIGARVVFSLRQVIPWYRGPNFSMAVLDAIGWIKAK